MTQRASWNVLKHWIQECENYELRTGSPAPLTEQQVEALNILVPDIVVPAPAPRLVSIPTTPAQRAQKRPPSPAGVVSGSEPDVSDVNWVGRLHEYLARIASQNPEYKEEEVQIPGNNVKWIISAVLHDTGESFPNSAHGFIDGQAPHFSKKKDAKQYAAMCALTYLEEKEKLLRSRNSSLPPRSTISLKRSRNSSVSGALDREGVSVEARAKQSKLSAVALRRSEAKSQSTVDAMDVDRDAADNDTVITPLTPPKQSSPKNTPVQKSPSTKTRLRTKSTGSDSEPDTQALVREACTRLGIVHPQYRITEFSQDGNLPGFWNIRVDFGKDTHKVPSDLGSASKIFTKHMARTVAMEEVLKWLDEEEEKRRGEMAAILGDVGEGAVGGE